jgi:hypothetical protein
MSTNMAHIAVRVTTGRQVSVAVFEANAANGTDLGRQRLLDQLTTAASRAGLKVEQAALAYSEHGRVRFFGTRTLVDHLARSGVPRWTHQLNV